MSLFDEAEEERDLVFGLVGLAASAYVCACYFGNGS